MNVQLLEKLNNAKLPKKYHATANKLDQKLIIDLAKTWENEDKATYFKLLREIPADRESYYILAIWLHPMTQLQQIAVELGKMGVHI